METIRSFIAIELPEELKKELSRLEAELARKCPPGCARWVNPEGIHLTIKFLGNIKMPQVSEIARAVAAACLNASPFELKVTEIGVFPSLKRIQIIWIGVSGELQKLGGLQKSIDERVCRLGFAPERRPLTPHLTLARIRGSASPEERKQLADVLSEARYGLAATIRIGSVSLMQSELTPAGAVYHRIMATPLGGTPG